MGALMDTRRRGYTAVAGTYRAKRTRLTPVGTAILVFSLLSLGLAATPQHGLAAGSRLLPALRPATRAAAYPDGTLIKGDRTPQVYVLYDGAAHWIVSPAVLDLLGFAGKPIITLPQRTVDALHKGGNFVERVLSSASNGLPNPFSPIATVLGNLVTDPPSAPAGATVTIKGFGYAPHEQVQLNLADGGLVAQVAADATGTFTTSLVVPASRPAGIYRLTGAGLSSGRFGIEPFAIEPATAHPTLAPAPTFTTVGGSFTVSGGGFQAGEILYLYDAGVYGVSSAANSAGAYGPVTLQVPAGVTVGIHSIWVYGATSHLFAAGSFIVAPPLPASVQVSPPNTTAGGQITISGAGFVPTEAVALSVDGRSVGQVTADSTGAFSGAAVTIPAGIPAGQAAITARGLSSGRAASAVVTVTALTPHLLVSPADGAPGTALTVAGAGFAPGESVTLSFNGAALPTTPAAITADAQGNFFASTAIPAAALGGRDAVTATGTRSGAVATALVTVRLPIAATWYFAGLDMRPGAHSVIAVLNPDNSPAQVTLHVAFPDAPARDHTVTVAAHSRTDLDMARFADGRRTLLFVRLTSSHRIGAAQATFRGARDWSSTPGVSAPRRTWYLAEGSTHAPFQEYLRLYNPHGFPIPVTILLLPQRGRAQVLRLAVGGDSGREVLVNRHLRGQGVSAIVGAGASIVVDRLSLFGRGDFGASEDTGAPGASSTWFFTPEATRRGDRVSYTLLNPNGGNPAAVTATFYSSGGRLQGARTIIVAPRRRGSITPPRAGTTAVLTSNVPVVAERAIYYGRLSGRDAVGGSTAYGDAGGALTWEFPEGDTGGGQSETLLLRNPSGRAATISIDFYTAAGTATATSLTVPARGYATLPVNHVAGLPAGAHSALLSATNGVPFIAAQSIRSADGRRGESLAGIAL